MIEILLTGVIFIGWCIGWMALRNRKKFLLVKAKPEKKIPVRLSVIIPARNEEKNLPYLFETLPRSSTLLSGYEVIVVDDASEDRTAQIAEFSGARVIRSQSLPAGWTGKTWACHQGARAAIGDVLLFLDADTRFELDGLEKLVAIYSSVSGPIALSVLPDFICERFYENLSAFFFISMAWGTRALGGGVSHEDRLVGQSLMIRKEDYFRAGGHEAVRGEILENLFFSRCAQGVGIQTQSIPGRGILKVRMFPEGIEQLIAGWRKSFAKGSQAISAIALVENAFWMTSVICVGVEFFVFRSWMGVVAYLAVVIQLHQMLKRIGQFSVWVAPLFPIYLVFYQGVFFHSWLNQKRGYAAAWKGRNVPQAPSLQSPSVTAHKSEVL